MIDGLLKPGEAARRVGCSPSTIVRWIRQGKLAARKLAGHRLLIHPDDLAALLQPAGRQKTAAEEAAEAWRKRGFQVGGA